MQMKVIVAISGASGALYAIRLIEVLSENTEITLVASETAKKIIAEESDYSFEDLENLADEVFENHDMEAGICSGSRAFDAMVIVPCSMATLGKIACGISDNVITRAASVAMKERRKLITVPREAPVSSIHLENMLKLSREGVVILPASPGFYGCPQTAADLVDFIVGRIMDQLGLENDIYSRWAE